MGVLYLKLFMHVTVFSFVLLWSVVFEVFFMHVTVFDFVLFCYVMLWLVIIKIL